MSVIGAFLVPEQSIATRIRKTVLVTQVPIAPVALLVVACIAYAVFGTILGLLAWQVATTNVYQVVDMLSVGSLSRYAFNDRTESDSDGHERKIGFAKCAERYTFELHARQCKSVHSTL